MLYAYIKTNALNDHLRTNIIEKFGSVEFIENNQTQLSKENLINKIKSGDYVIVSNPLDCGKSMLDSLDFFCKLSQKNIFLYDMSSSETLNLNVNLLSGLIFLYNAEKKIRLRTSHLMRTKRLESGNLGGAPKKIAEDQKKLAAHLWKKKYLTINEISEQTGISARSLTRLFGKRYPKD